jgi:glycosyltransferase involved in cell wall biosynthesis
MPADLIKPGQNGLLAEIEDVTGLTEYALALIEDTQLRENCRRQALVDVQQYDWSLIAERYYDELYQPILKREDLSQG